MLTNEEGSAVDWIACRRSKIVILNGYDGRIGLDQLCSGDTAQIEVERLRLLWENVVSNEH